MRLRPGRNLLLLGMALLAVGLLGSLWSTAFMLMPLLLAAGIVFIVFDALDLRKLIDAVSIARPAGARIARGIPYINTITVANRHTRAAVVELRDMIPDSAEPRLFTGEFLIPADSERRVEYSITFPSRGEYKVGPVWARLTGRFGFLEIQREYKETTSLSVLPESLAGHGELEKKALAESMMLMRQSRTRLHGDGMEFESLVEYRPGDDVRRVDWRSSARHRHLVVRRYQVEQHRDVMILIDTGRLMGADTGKGSKLDRAVDAALMLARVATQKGDRCGIGVFDDKVQGFLPPVAGPQAMRIITEAVYNIQSRWREANFRAMFATLQARLQKRALVIILSDLVDEDTTEQYRAAIHSLARRHLIIFVALRTPLLDEIKTEQVDDTLDVSRKAVALRLLRQRERALDTLSRGSIHVLDVEPRDITVPLVNKYIALRERNLL